MLTNEFARKVEANINKDYYAKIEILQYHKDEYIGKKDLSVILTPGDTITITINGVSVEPSECNYMSPKNKWWEVWK